jgi:hypothetical protein
MNKLCETKPNSEMPKMIVSVDMTVTNNKKLPVTNFEKQSQTNPIQSQNLIAVRGAKLKQTRTNPNLFLSFRIARLNYFNDGIL